ncbi:hypothetical protein [Streptomyces sp. NPDC003077]|uniref:hypothetical protein n=1 Tax=Streptomyces sp. NPDC003077 TaxID=3154443 RepID=UPI00339EE2A1
MKKIKAAVIAASALAGVAVAAPTAQAGECSKGGRTYICEYGVTKYQLPDGRKQQFVVAPDRSVWTRWIKPGTSDDWSKWISMGGRASTKAYVYDYDTSDPWSFTLFYYDEHAEIWGRDRDHDGNWTDWTHRNTPING